MAKMTERMKELFDKVRPVVLSTASIDGIPNAVPVGAKKILDDQTILILRPVFQQNPGQHDSQPPCCTHILGRPGRIPAEGHGHHRNHG